MSNSLMIEISEDDDELVKEFEQRLKPYAEVTPQPPAVLGLETVKLIVEIASLGVGLVGAGATTVKTIMDIREQLKKQGKAHSVTIGRPGTRGVSLEEADERLLQELLGVEE